MIPSIAILRIQSPYYGLRGIPIVLPLFLLWIPALLLAPLVLIVLACACAVFRVGFFKTVGVSWAIVSALRGTEVRVTAESKRITVRIL